jgi:peptide/nickel transport system substrate-binding protein
VLNGHGEVAPSVDQQENVESVLSSAEAEKLFGELDTYQFDTKKAEEEMAKSSHPDGFSETVVYDGTAPDLGRVAQVIAQELEPLGIKLTVKPLPDQQYVNSVFFEHSVPSAVVDFTTDIQDPISLPNYLTASSNMLSNGGYTDIAEWSDPRMDKALESYLAGNVEDKAGQAKLLSEALKIMNEEEPYVPIYHSDYLMALEDGLTYSNFNGFWWEYRWPDLIGTE